MSRSLHMEAVNKVLRRMGTGAFHCGVEVYGEEFSFRGGDHAGTGVFWQAPRTNRFHSWVEALPMGMTTMLKVEVMMLVRRLRKAWPSKDYDILKRNCCHFCNDFCQLLGVGSIPRWVMHLADTGAALLNEVDTAKETLNNTRAQVQACCQPEVQSCSSCSLMVCPTAHCPDSGSGLFAAQLAGGIWRVVGGR
eukprot:CAMPEP_0175263714 /NCGR_PEP_ID=MMETSP0093-20121207/41930_1 /TAXON_ID=311494 /ORGANISM="Alexandrium monilatum, Strain CCMP3105" /LENGTH=192 /DNA_ID=CAMNT_0016558237 /DNA_START=14 /DNA_END=592 /DNA_ORIENTATION=+